MGIRRFFNYALCGLLLCASTTSRAGLVSFESQAIGVVITNQFQGTDGIVFLSGAGLSTLVVGGVDDATQAGWVYNPEPTGAPNLPNHFATGQGGGNGVRFLTNQNKAEVTTTLKVQFLAPVAALSFDLIDIDGYQSFLVAGSLETFTVEALAADLTTVVESYTIDGNNPLAGDGRVTRAGFARVSNDIHGLRVVGSRPAGGFGLAFDNFNTNAFTPSIGLAKQVGGAVTTLADGTVTVPFSLVVKNLGIDPLNAVSVSDDLSGASPQFGGYVAGGSGASLSAGQYTIQVAPVFSGACSGGTANSAYTGDADQTVASITSLAVGASCTVTFTLRFLPSGPTPVGGYLNQASATGTDSVSGLSTTDTSDNGATPDPNGNGNANETGENDPTPVTPTFTPSIGLAKALNGALTDNLNGSYTGSFRFVVKNLGNEALSGVSINDAMNTAPSTFATQVAGGGAAVLAAGQYTIQSAPAFSGACAGGSANAAFDGNGTTQIASIASLPIGVTCTVDVGFRVFPPVGVTLLYNQATTLGTGAISGGVPTDSSDNGNQIDPDGDGDADAAGENDPTPVSTNLSPDIGVAKRVTGVVQTGAKRYQVSYSMVLSNPGNVVSPNVQVSDNLSTTFPTAQSMAISTPAAVSGCTGTVLNVASPAFDGTAQLNLLAGNQALNPGERCTITFTTEIDFGTNPLPSTAQNNQALATTAATPGGAATASDLSDDGVEPDPNSNGNPGDAGEDDPTPVSFAAGALSAVTGKIYLDVNHNQLDDDGAPATARAQGFIVEVLNAVGTVVASAVADANGAYSVTGLFPSTTGNAATYYSVRFKEPLHGTIYGLARSADPTPARNGTIDGGVITQLQLASGTTTINQDLPLDPAGVVYDAVTRLPVAGAEITLGGPAGLVAADVVGGSLSQTTGANGMYQFLLNASAPSGDYTLTVTTYPAGYLSAASTLIPVCTNTLVVGAAPNPALVQTSNSAPAVGATLHTPSACPATSAALAPANQATTQYFFTFTLAIGTSANALNNHIPLDPQLSGAIRMTKTTPLINVSKGDLVPYTITATNTLAGTLNNVDLRDLLPPGFKYKTGSASYDDDCDGPIAPVSLEPTVNGRQLNWVNSTFTASGTARSCKRVKLILVVGAGVGEGEYTNQIWAVNTLLGTQISNSASATVRVVPDPTFDCSDLIGKVFDDQNANGYQDEGEPGLPNVRVATARGLLVTSDKNGRFHVACADIPQAQRGSNFIMKLDERSLPSGYRITTENPREVRTTRGKLVKLNFGAAIHRVVRLELTDAAFLAGKPDPATALASALDKLPETLRVKPSVVRLAYQAGKADGDLARERLRAVRERLEELWKARGCCYTLVFEEEIFERAATRKGGAK